MFKFVPLLDNKGWPNFNSLKLAQVTATKSNSPNKAIKFFFFILIRRQINPKKGI